MSALLYKDFVILKKVIIFILAFFVLFSGVAIYQSKPQVIPAVFLLIPIILIMMAFGDDVRSNAEKYIIPAPVSKKTIVLSRYCLLWITAAVSVAVTLIVYSFTKIGNVDIPWYIIAPIMLLLTTDIAIIQIPLLYAFGRDMGQIIFILFYFLIFLGISQMGKRASEIAEFIKKLLSANLLIIAVLLLGGTVLLNVLSFVISLTIYKRKEF